MQYSVCLERVSSFQVLISKMLLSKWSADNLRFYLYLAQKGQGNTLCTKSTKSETILVIFRNCGSNGSKVSLSRYQVVSSFFGDALSFSYNKNISLRVSCMQPNLVSSLAYSSSSAISLKKLSLVHKRLLPLDVCNIMKNILRD